MSRWQSVSLKSVTSIISDGLHGTPKYDLDGDYYFINGNNLGDRKIVTNETTKKSSKEEYLKYRKKLSDRTILLSINGTIGNVAFYNNEKVFLGKSICYLNVLESVNKHFIYYIIKNKNFQDYIISLAAGTTIKNVSLKLVRDYILKLPSLGEQRAIAAVLGALDDKIELNRRMNETLETMAQALFKSWFVDFDPVKAKAEGCKPEGMDDATAALFPSHFDSKNVPQGWRFKYVSEAIELNPYEKLPKGKMSPYFEMAILPTKGCNPAPPIIREFSSGTKFRNGDTLLARITPCLENGKTAYINCLPIDQVAWGSTEFIVMRAKSPLPPEYTYLLARDENFRAHAIQSMTGTSGRQRVQIDALGKYGICIPTEEVAQKFGQYVSPMFRRIAVLSKESNILSQIRDTLLPRLISGKLRVDEISETVEALAL